MFVNYSYFQDLVTLGQYNYKYIPFLSRLYNIDIFKQCRINWIFDTLENIYSSLRFYLMRRWKSIAFRHPWLFVRVCLFGWYVPVAFEWSETSECFVIWYPAETISHGRKSRRNHTFPIVIHLLFKSSEKNKSLFLRPLIRSSLTSSVKKLTIKNLIKFS